LGLALSSQVVGGKTIRYVTHPSGVNIGYVAPEGQAWFLTDRLGTVIGLASNSGSLIASYSYDPTGIPRATVETGTVAGYNIHRYAGGLLDKTTGLTRFGVRWYNPATGRFTTPDPSGKEKNTYLYASGNTCNRTDPRGECSWDSPVTTAGAIFGGLSWGMDVLSTPGALLLLGVESTPVGWAGASIAFGAVALGATIYCIGH